MPYPFPHAEFHVDPKIIELRAYIVVVGSSRSFTPNLQSGFQFCILPMRWASATENYLNSTRLSVCENQSA